MAKPVISYSIFHKKLSEVPFFTMLKILQEIKELVSQNEKLSKIIQKYAFLDGSNGMSIEHNQKDFQNFSESEIIVINQFQESKEDADNCYFFIIFKKTLISIHASSIKLLQQLFSNKPKLNIYFLSNTKEVFDSKIKINYNHVDNAKTKKAPSIFSQNFFIPRASEKRTNAIFDIILDSISTYLIEQSYLKLNKDRLSIIQTPNSTNKVWKDDEYCELNLVGTGYSFKVILIYHFEREELFAIKKPNYESNETPKLIKREIENYKNIDFRFFPKFYGVNKHNNLIIEFIDGTLLNNINMIHLNDHEKIHIIFELMYSISYAHSNQFVLRDLKPNNIIIDNHKDIVVIDFDRMVKISDEIDEKNRTNDFSHIYMAPEVNEGKVSFANDIYSLGKIIYFIMEEKNDTNSENQNIKNQFIHQIYADCTKSDPNQRPSIMELFFHYSIHFYSELSDKFFCNDPSLCYIFGRFLYDGIAVERKIKMAIDFFTKAADNNCIDAQFTLALIYEKGEDVPRDITKAIHYYDLAAIQNDENSQINLGSIYFEGLYVQPNLEKAKYYYSMAADNHDNNYAQFTLGLIYFQESKSTLEIQKSIHYFELASKKNPRALFFLGIIYEESQYIEHDIDKAIDYYQKASDKNVSDAQFVMSEIYLLAKHGKFDANKGVHYLKLAADNNNAEAQFRMGILHRSSPYVKQDINKVIDYLTKAANNNHADSQFLLGYYYYNGLLGRVDVSKAIHYFKLASQQNHADANFFLGIIHFDGKLIPINASQAIHYFILAAQQNKVDAQFILGNIYSFGENVKADINKAIHFYSLAAMNNHAIAQFNLGYIYHVGKFIKPDIDKAKYFYSLAANQNHAKALSNLSEIYLSSNDPFDHAKGIDCLTKVANLGFSYAQCQLGAYYMRGENVKKDIEKSIHFFSLAAKNDHPEAQYNLGLLYFNGDNVKRDIKKALEYLNLAAKHDHAHAIFIIGLIFYLGVDVQRDVYKAISYFLRAAEHNYIESYFYLGIIHLSGQLIQRDLKKSYHYFTLAADQNSPGGQLYLGIMYLFGYYVKSDLNKAINLLELASKQHLYEANFLLGMIYHQEKNDVEKAIHYLTLGANNGDKNSQYYLSMLYFQYSNISSDINKATYYLSLSVKNHHPHSYFPYAFLYHEGKCFPKDIDTAIHYYKEASSLEDPLAKNNLGIIYKNGFEDKIKKNYASAIVYFEEAIKISNDFVSMYNLAHIYLYNDEIDKSIDLLIKSAYLGFNPSINLLCLALIKKYGNDFDSMKKKIDENNIGKSIQLSSLVIRIIQNEQLCDKTIFEKFYSLNRTIDYLYNHLAYIVKSKNINEKVNLNQPNQKFKIDISKQFYEGFGISI